MADQQSRGGKKEGGNDPQAPQTQQHVKPESERPGKGEPGGPKEGTGTTKHAGGK